jgi:hypothetical protein
MTAYLPPTRVDFGRPEMAEWLPVQVESVLREAGLDTQVYANEWRRYLRSKGTANAVPWHMIDMASRYVQVLPLEFSDMEAVLGSKAREFCPRADEIPQIVWDTLDFLTSYDPEQAQSYRYELYPYIEYRVGTRQKLIEVAVKHLRRAGYNPSNAAAFNRRNERHDQQETA